MILLSVWSSTQRHEAITEIMINVKFSTNYNGGMSRPKPSVSMKNFVINEYKSQNMSTSAEQRAARSEVTLAELHFQFL